MEIRKVQASDIPKVKKLADSLVATSESKDRTSGFYDYRLTLEQYERRSESDLFLVGCSDSELEGFCMAYDLDFVRRLIEQEPQLRNDAIFNHLFEQQEDFVYLDQLAVKSPRTFIRGIYACRLFEKLKEKSERRQSIQVAIPHSPWKNETSIRSFTHRGAKLLKEITGKNQVIFGVYRFGLV